MKGYFIFTILCFSSLLSFSQQLKLEKASPFTAVRWEKEQPIVQFEGEWYDFEKLDVFTKEELLAFCKKEYGSKWQKRFSEDLVEVLQELGYQPTIKIPLKLSKDGISKSYIGTFTSENRNSSVLYNKSIAEPNSTILPQRIPAAEALEDLKQFEEILTSISSYSQLSTFDYKFAIKKIADSIVNENTQVDMNRLANEIAKIMAEIGDRHSSVKNESFNKKNHKTYNLWLPFGVTTLNGKIIGLKKDDKSGNFKYYLNSHPNIKSINGITVETLVNIYNYRDKKAPEQAKLIRGSSAIQRYGVLLFENNIACPDSVAVVFTNGNAEKTEMFPLTPENRAYSSRLLQEHMINSDKISKKSFEGLSKIVGQNIGYLNIPEMYGYEDVDGLENSIKNAIQRFSNTKALIIDIRSNPGGGREILQTFAGYIIQPKQSPWVANVAYLRTNDNKNGDEESMSARYLYSYHSEQFSDRYRKAIDQFINDSKFQKAVDTSRFSNAFYMVLHGGKAPYKQPIYILVNEESFSAASVFASAFKDLPNVKIVGETTDGSSGNSRTLYLKNSNIKISVSTMLSFQRNGKTLDGNGTTPDIIIHADEKQILNGYDSQLNELIKIINNNK